VFTQRLRLLRLEARYLNSIVPTNSPTMTPLAVQTASWRGSVPLKVGVVRTKRVAEAAAIPISAHNIDAGKKAPNNSNEGAPMCDYSFASSIENRYDSCAARTRLQAAGLMPVASRNRLLRCAWSVNPHCRAMSLKGASVSNMYRAANSSRAEA
jgi:hypothetical protein